MSAKPQPSPRSRPIPGGLPPDVETRRVPGFDGKYVAGSDGHIYCYSTSRTTARFPRPFRVSEAIGSNGYPFVAAIIGGQRVTNAVHRMVCTAWHGEQAGGQCVRHLDGDKSNSRPENLAWGTFAQNEADKKRHGRVARGERHGQVKLTEEGVRIIRASIPFGLWDANAAAEVFGVDAGTISRIAQGRGWEHVK